MLGEAGAVVRVRSERSPFVGGLARPAGVPRVARPVSMRGPLPCLTELPETLGADLGRRSSG